MTTGSTYNLCDGGKDAGDRANQASEDTSNDAHGRAELANNLEVGGNGGDGTEDEANDNGDETTDDVQEDANIDEDGSFGR